MQTYKVFRIDIYTNFMPYIFYAYVIRRYIGIIIVQCTCRTILPENLRSMFIVACNRDKPASHMLWPNTIRSNVNVFRNSNF